MYRVKVRYDSKEEEMFESEYFHVAQLLLNKSLTYIGHTPTSSAWRSMMAAELYETSFSCMEADVKSVCEKIKGLTKIQVSSVLDRVAEFWNNQNGTRIELDKWSKW